MCLFSWMRFFIKCVLEFMYFISCFVEFLGVGGVWVLGKVNRLCCEDMECFF